MSGTLENLTINGYSTSSTVIPTVAGLQPSLHWEYIEPSGGYPQKYINVRVSTSSAFLGSDLFTGGVISETKYTTSNIYELLPYLLLRGVKYYGQIQIVDDNDGSTLWYPFVFKTNNLPSISDLTIIPSSPSPLDNLELSYHYSDLDGHEESNTIIKWFKFNIPQTDFDGLRILPSSALKINDSWYARIIPNDGIEYGFAVETDTVTITNINSPYLSDITLTPENPNVDDLIKVSYSVIENEYVSIQTSAIINWYVNEILVTDFSGDAIDQPIVRLTLIPGDVVRATIKLTDLFGNVLNESESYSVIILDVDWHIDKLTVSGLTSPQQLQDTQPQLEWEKYKTTATEADTPAYLRVLVTKTKSLDSPIYDTGDVSYTKDYFIIPENVLVKGESYYINVGIGDTTPIPDTAFETQSIALSGSGWSNNVDNEIGWTIELKIKVDSNNAIPESEGATTDEPNLGVNIQDGTYACLIVIYKSKILFMSDSVISWEVPDGEETFDQFRTVRISGKDNNVMIHVDNVMVINAVGKLVRESKFKILEYGDIDTKWENQGTIGYFKYSTDGAYDLDLEMPNRDTILFYSLGNIVGGIFTDLHKNVAIWTPDDLSLSSKLIKLNDTADDVLLRTTSTNSSAITSIFIDQNRNKYIGTANGVTAIYGEKHDADYTFNTTDSITPADFDRISTLGLDLISLAEPSVKSGWLTIDTTHSAIGTITGTVDDDPYLYSYASHAIHYYSQRVHGHAWFDKVDNQVGWQLSFDFQLEKIEQDDFDQDYVVHQGFGIYINDGKFQEIVYFYPDRIRLYYANVYIPISTTSSRQYRIAGKGNSIFIYQKLLNAPTGSDQLIVDGSGLFTTSSTRSGSSEKPRIEVDSTGIFHSVWHDDGDKKSQILYSKQVNGTWSIPEIVDISNNFQLRNPSITIDSLDRIWIAYEDSSFGGNTEISVSVKDSIGWNRKTRVTRFTSDKARPAIKCDNNDTIHLVWEDNRNGVWEILRATWDNTAYAWNSSNFFSYDIPVIANSYQIPYVSTDFKNAKLSYAHPYLWIVAEGLDKESGSSSIYVGLYNSTDNTWQSEGSPVYDSDGSIIGFSSGVVASETNSFYTNPDIAASNISGQTVIVWEDDTGSYKKIMATVYDYSDFIVLQSPQTVVSQNYNCSNPSVGWSGQRCIIASLAELSADFFQINISFWNSSTSGFFGSNASGYDQLIETSSKSVGSCCLLPISSDGSESIVVCDFVDKREDSTVLVSEYPKMSLIETVKIELDTIDLSSNALNYSEEYLVSSLDTKEFAFGDFSESVGIRAHWKNFKMYFGYDARPYSIEVYNNKSVIDWPDNRVNDLFVDVFGNIIAATFNGLLYYKLTNGTLTNIQDFVDKIVTAVEWGKNGIWHVGTTDGAYYTSNAGKSWLQYTDTLGTQINSISVSTSGLAIIGTDQGIFVVNPVDGSMVTRINSFDDPFIRVVKIDDGNIIWAGTNSGLYRVENYSYIIKYNSDNGMRSSYVTDIAIVNKYLRYVGTTTGIERMFGTRFTNMNTKTVSLFNDNISSLLWDQTTKSLWVGSNGVLHEIVFRDDSHEIIDNETVQYDYSEISTSQITSRKNFYLLDSNKLLIDNNSIDITSESTYVYINRNLVTFGYSVDPDSFVIKFDCDLLPSDSVTIRASNTFTEFYNFNQSSIEKTVEGFKRITVAKVLSTSALLPTTKEPQYLVITNTDKNSIQIYAGESRLPFTTIMIDNEAPFGCLEFIENITPTTLKFKILADDQHSGLSGYLLSNYENLTSDGETPLEYKPIETIVNHDIGADLNNVFTFFEIPNTATIGETTYNTGTGSCCASRLEQIAGQSGSVIEYLYLGTSNPGIIFKYDPSSDEWSPIQILNNGDLLQRINKLLAVNNVLYAITGSDDPLQSGSIYRSTDGNTFDLLLSLNGTSDILSIVDSSDGNIYFGTDTGAIYKISNNIPSLLYDGIESRITSLEIFNTSLLVATGNKGRVYKIDLTTGNNSIIMDSDDNSFSNIIIKDKNIVAQESEALIYISSADNTTIYKGLLSSQDFSVSYKSYPEFISRVKTVDNFVLDQNIQTNTSSTSVVASVGSKLFVDTGSGWEFFYSNTESISDFIQYSTSGIDGLFIVSDTKITKWTNILNTKTVYLSLKDKAGNISGTPDEVPCSAYEINISDLKGFVNESRIVHVSGATTTDSSEYGPQVLFSYNSPTGSSFFSADQIDEEIGIYNSEVFNGSNDLVAWKSISWTSSEPDGTSVVLQVRSASIEADITNSEWSPDLSKNSRQFVSLESMTDQYFQFRAILTSTVKDLSPTLTSITIRNITTKSTHFFTTNFVLTSRPIKGILTANTFLPVSADIVFGIDTNDSVDFASYQIVESERIFTTADSQLGSNIRLGVRLISPSLPGLPTVSENPYTEYGVSESQSYSCSIPFNYQNNTGSTKNVHFKVNFYSGPERTDDLLIYTFFSGNDQYGWLVNGSRINSTGISLSSGSSVSVEFEPNEQVVLDELFYLTIEANDESSWTSIDDVSTYSCETCFALYEPGLIAEYYKSDISEEIENVPSFSSMTPDYVLNDAMINFEQLSLAAPWTTADGTALSFYILFAIRWRGLIYIPETGAYKFSTESDDGSILYIDDNEVVNNDGLHDTLKIESDYISLAKGYHTIAVTYFQRYGNKTMILRWTKPGNTEAVVPSSSLFHYEVSEYCTASVPKLYNFMLMFELENGEKIKINI